MVVLIGFTGDIFVKTYLIYQLKYMWLCQLYLSKKQKEKKIPDTKTNSVALASHI